MKKAILFIIFGVLFSLTSSAQCDITFSPAGGVYNPGELVDVNICYQDYSGGFPAYALASWTAVSVSGSNGAAPSVTPIGAGNTMSSSYCINVKFLTGAAGNSVGITATGTQTVAPFCSKTRTQSYVLIPIELESFVVNQKDDVALLEWVTLSETNFSHFEMEISLDGKDFKGISKVKGQGESRDRVSYSLKYELPDYTKQSPFIYFRLKQHDLDGLFTYSDIIVLSNDSKRKGSFALLNAYYDKTSMNFDFTSMNNGVIQARIINLNGQTLLTKDVDVREGFNSITLPFNGISGMYLIQVMNNNNMETKKVFVN